MSKSIRGACGECQAPYGICVCAQNQRRAGQAEESARWRTRLEKVRDELKGVTMANPNNGVMLAGNALRMLEAILEGKEP